MKYEINFFVILYLSIWKDISLFVSMLPVWCQFKYETSQKGSSQVVSGEGILYEKQTYIITFILHISFSTFLLTTLFANIFYAP